MAIVGIFNCTVVFRCIGKRVIVLRNGRIMRCILPRKSVKCLCEIVKERYNHTKS